MAMMQVRLSGSWTEVQAGLEKLQAGSVAATVACERHGSRAMGWGALTAITVVTAWFVNLFEVAGASTGGAMVGLPALVLGLIEGHRSHRHSKKILDEDKLAAAAALLRTLEPDGARRAKVKLCLDLRPLEKSPHPTRPKGPKIGDKWGPWEHYRQTWLRLRVQLALGQDLDLRLTRCLRTKTYPKRATTRVKQFCQDRLTLPVGHPLRNDPPRDFRPVSNHAWQRGTAAQLSHTALVEPVLHLLVWIFLSRRRD